MATAFLSHRKFMLVDATACWSLQQKKTKTSQWINDAFLLDFIRLQFGEEEKNGKSWQSETRSTNDLENQLETDASDFFLSLLLRLDGDSFAGYVITVVYWRWNTRRKWVTWNGCGIVNLMRQSMTELVRRPCTSAAMKPETHSYFDHAATYWITSK